MSEIKIRKRPDEDVVQISLINADGEGLTIGMPEENFRTLFSAMQKGLAQLDPTVCQARAEELERDAQRYRKLRSIGAAPNNTRQLGEGLVLVAQVLDEWIDKTWPLGDELRTHAVLRDDTPAPKIHSAAEEAELDRAREMLRGVIVPDAPKDTIQ